MKNKILNPSLLKIIFVYFKSNQNQIFKFVLVGVTTFFINFLTFHYFYGICKFNYKTAASFSYTITVIAHFTFHRAFTFKMGENNDLSYNIIKYLIMLILNYITTITTMWLTVNVAHNSAYLGLIVSTAATATLSFVIMKYFVFSCNRSTPQSLT